MPHPFMDDETLNLSDGMPFQTCSCVRMVVEDAVVFKMHVLIQVCVYILYMYLNAPEHWLLSYKIYSRHSSHE